MERTWWRCCSPSFNTAPPSPILIEAALQRTWKYWRVDLRLVPAINTGFYFRFQTAKKLTFSKEMLELFEGYDKLHIVMWDTSVNSFEMQWPRSLKENCVIYIFWDLSLFISTKLHFQCHSCRFHIVHLKYNQLSFCDVTWRLKHFLESGAGNTMWISSNFGKQMFQWHAGKINFAHSHLLWLLL